jgi:hypothetical protein
VLGLEKKEMGRLGPRGEEEGRELGSGWIGPRREGKRAREGKKGGSCWAGLGEEVGCPFFSFFFFLFFSTLKHSNHSI